MSTHDRLTYLFEQALRRTATAAELQELSLLLSNDQSGAMTRQLEILLQKELPANAQADYDIAHWDMIVDNILAADRPVIIQPTIQRRLWRWIPASAAAVLILAGAFLLFKPTIKPPVVASAPGHHDFAPGGNKAVLTLADGTELALDSSASGALTQQGNTKITQPAGGQLAYNSQPGAGGATQYNTLRTPKGGQFQVLLPDGSKVWLNAASSLKYPVAFNGTSRQVELTGEAYFEIASNAAMPFKVLVPKGLQDQRMEVAVLGTQFNIMAYADEAAIKTTLLEGAVNVTNQGISKKLMPGQGALLDKQHDQLTLLQQVNTEEAVAWKNGFIQLEGNDIATVMRMIARWYDVEVVFTDPVPSHFRGTIPRNVPVSQVLKLLEMTGEVHFEIRGRQIIVSH